MLGKIFQGLKDIETNYLGHAGDMEELVINSENTSMEYQNAMETTLTDISNTKLTQTRKSRHASPPTNASKHTPSNSPQKSTPT